MQVAALELVWVATIRRARGVLGRCQAAPPELCDVPALRRELRELEREHRRAVKVRHVLAWSLEEAIDDLAVLADACAPRTLLPNPPLEAQLRQLRLRMDRRAREYALASAKFSRVMLKLYALACFIGDRTLAPAHIPGVNDALFGLAPKPSKSAVLPFRSWRRKVSLTAGFGASTRAGIKFVSTSSGSHDSDAASEEQKVTEEAKEDLERMIAAGETAKIAARM